METNVNYTIVGLFVIVLFTTIVMAIIWLSAGFSFEKYDIYKVYMEESVSGLTTDSPVEFNGVQVGNVLKIKIDKKNPRLVVLLLRVKHTTPITRGTVAMLTTRGITGFVYITLIDKGSNPGKVTVQPREHYPVLPTQPSIFVRLDTALTQISNSFTHIDEAMSNLLSKDNIETLRELIFSMKKVANTLANNSQNIDTTLKNLESASKNLTPMLKSGHHLFQSGQGAIRTFETQTLPAANQALINIENASRVLNDLANQLKQNPSMLLRGRAPGTPGPGESIRH